METETTNSKEGQARQSYIVLGLLVFLLYLYSISILILQRMTSVAVVGDNLYAYLVMRTLRENGCDIH
jgi:hypothetical protein